MNTHFLWDISGDKNTKNMIAEYDYGDEIDFEMFCETLQEKMGSNIYFRINGKNLDWLHRSGEKYIQATTAIELLKAIYSEDLLYLYNGKKKSHFEINAPTHDTPTGSFYYFTPISERTYQKLS